MPNLSAMPQCKVFHTPGNKYDPTKPLGKPGGFGQVFLGESPSGAEIAVKKLHLSAADAAHRELRIADELKGDLLSMLFPLLTQVKMPTPEIILLSCRKPRAVSKTR